MQKSFDSQNAAQQSFRASQSEPQCSIDTHPILSIQSNHRSRKRGSTEAASDPKRGKENASSAMIAQDDLSPEDFNTLCDEFYKREVVVTKQKAEDIEKLTQEQAKCDLWHQQRRLRVTASNFHMVARQHKSTDTCISIANTLVYPRKLHSKEIKWGRKHEKDAQKAYVEYLKYQGCDIFDIKKSGLVIDEDENCLACSPDGLVDIPVLQDPFGVVEYKCPYNIAHDEPLMTPVEAAAERKGFYCTLNEDGDIQLKKTDKYYYQVQGTLAITQREWCDFVIWTPQGISVERIRADKEFWGELKPKLISFYKKYILPELTSPKLSKEQ